MDVEEVEEGEEESKEREVEVKSEEGKLIEAVEEQTVDEPPEEQEPFQT